MKAILEFNLPEEQSEHADAINGTQWRCAVQTIDQTLRNRLKHDDIPETTREVLLWVRELIYQETNDLNQYL